MRRRNKNKRWWWSKRAIALVIVGVIVHLVLSAAIPRATAPEDIRYGVTFSSLYARELGLDPVEAFSATLELGARLFRIPVYWDHVEPERDVWLWGETDAIVDRAEANGAEIVMAMGRRVPRWPECFTPEWALVLSDADREAEQFAYVRAVVERYKSRDAVIRWQVENEPYFEIFGDCADRPLDGMLAREVAMVYEVDPTRQVQTTVPGELGLWYKAARDVDIVGTSVYRTTYTPFLGHNTYPVPTWWYRLKARMIAPTRVVVSELQAEPWFPGRASDLAIEEQLALFDAHDLERHLRYAQRIGLSEVMLWGAEWWYYLRENGEPSLWNAADAIAW